MSSEIDWEKLAAMCGLLTENGESSSSDAACRALEILLGEEALRASVDYYIEDAAATNSPAACFGSYALSVP